MLTLKVTIEGKREGDIGLALDEVKRLVSEGYLRGANSNDTGNYLFDLDGEAEAEPCDECGEDADGVDGRHAASCSLHPANIVEPTVARGGV